MTSNSSPTWGMLNEVEIQNIELRAENERLRAALEKISRQRELPSNYIPREIALNALHNA